jgi:hypothetical protein
MMTLAIGVVLLAATADQPTIDKALTNRFVKVETLSGVDPAVATQLRSKVAGPIADRGEPFQATDVITDDRPQRRFVLAGRSDDAGTFWVVCYEHGGIGYHYHVALFQSQAAETRILVAGQWLPEYEERERPITLKRLVLALKRGEVNYDNHW